MASALEKIVDQRLGQPLVGAVSVAVDRMAEEIAREALADETFRRALRELVCSQKLLHQLVESGDSKKSAIEASSKEKVAFPLIAG